MKRVVSVSLGSSRRDHAVETEFAGRRVRVERIGTNGDLRRAAQLIRELDGQVDAFGLGGIDLYLYAGHQRYVLRDALKLARAAQCTPIVDGSGLKNTLERRVVRHLLHSGGTPPLAGANVLMVSAVDRFGMAEALTQAGCRVTFGDLIFGLGIPIALRSLHSLNRLARILLPIVTRVPFTWLYPTGERQEQVTPKYGQYYAAADWIAGDFHFIRRFMPDDLRGKAILTNTVTAQDVAELQRRGVSRLVTTTPELQGRSFGTNVMEAVLVALSGKPPDELSPSDYEGWLDRIGFRPRDHALAGADQAS